MTKKATITALMVGILVLIVLVMLDNPPSSIDVMDNRGDTASSERFQIAPTISQEDGSLDGGAALLALRPEEGNLTQGAGFNIAQEILSQGLEGTLPTEEELLDQVLSTSLDLDTEEFITVIDEGRLSVIQNPTSDDLDTYITEVAPVLEEYFINVDVNVNSLDANEFLKAVLVHDRTLENMYAVSVPSNWLAFHTENMRLIGAQKRIFENLADFENDPLKAIASVQTFQETSVQLQLLWDAFSIEVDDIFSQ